jgi:hypothetical protein
MPGSVLNRPDSTDNPTASFLSDRLHLTLGDIGEQQPTVTFWDIEKVHRFN